MRNMRQEIEYHPLEPFLPQNATVLMLGSFPPKHERWSMEFFYPNFQNDMWRIMGLIFFGDKNYFVIEGQRQFNYDKVFNFCNTKGIALYDTASAVIRLNDNAADKFLEIVEVTDINNLLTQIPLCNTIATTGQKATDVICDITGDKAPKVGYKNEIALHKKSISFYRMPSSSRAYPLSIDKKAEYYSAMFKSIKIL